MSCSLRDMAIFVAACEERSFTAAAQRENATQSGVSQHMRNLEHSLGVQLFLRERGGVTPTPAGVAFYRHCLKVMRAHAEARREMARFGRGLSGALVVGLMPTITRRLLAPALQRFLEEAPNVAVRVVEGYSNALTQQVQAGELDLAVVPAFAGLPGVRGRVFVRTPETLVSAAGMGAAPGAPLRLAELGPLRLVLPDRSNTRRQAIETYCAANAVEIAQLVELDAMLGTLDFVARGDWVTILPAVMMDPEAGPDIPGGLVANPIAAPELHTDLMLIEPARRPRSEAAARFAALLEAEAQTAAALWTTRPRSAADAPVRLVASGNG